MADAFGSKSPKSHLPGGQYSIFCDGVQLKISKDGVEGTLVKMNILHTVAKVKGGYLIGGSDDRFLKLPVGAKFGDCPMAHPGCGTPLTLKCVDEEDCMFTISFKRKGEKNPFALTLEKDEGSNQYFVFDELDPTKKQQFKFRIAD